MIPKVTLPLVIIISILTNCKYFESYDKLNDADLVRTCQSFAKAICTKDTTLFYQLVDKEALTASMNTWMHIQKGKMITEDDIYFPFFFVYSPLKIRVQDLLEIRNMKNYFSSFKINNLESINTSTLKVNIEWLPNLPSARTRKIELYLLKSNKWKVTNARWEV